MTNMVSFTHCTNRFKQWTDGAVSTGELVEALLVHMGTEYQKRYQYWMIRFAFWLVNHCETRWGIK